MGEVRDAGDIIDVVSINRTDTGNRNGQALGNDNVNDIKNGSDSIVNGNLTYRLQEINNIPEKRISVDELIRNLAGSGNDKQIKLAPEFLELNLVQESKLEQLSPDCFDKISASHDNLSTNTGSRNVEQAINTGNENKTSESDREWTTVKNNHKRNRSGCNDSEKLG